MNISKDERDSISVKTKPKIFSSYWIIIIAGIILFMPFLGRVALFDWDEVNFAEIAREMIVTHDYLNVQVDYQPFWEKPPLFIWMQVLSMKLFGINEFAARFPNAVCGIVTLLILFRIGKKLFNQRMGMIWALVYAGSVLPFFYFKSGIIDPWFNLFIFTGIYFAILYIAQSPSHPVTQSPSHPVTLFLSGLFIGLAILTKGPVAFLIFGLTGLVYLISSLPSYRPKVLQSYRPTVRFRLNIKLTHILLFLAGILLTGGSWFMMQIAAGNIDVVKDFIVYQVRLFSTKDAGHGGFPLYHVVVLMFGVFPASAFLFNGFKASPGELPLQREWRRASIILLLIVVVLFEIVQTKIIHYSSLAYFPLTYLSSLAIYRVVEEKSRFSRLAKILLIAFTSLWIIVIAGFTIAGLQKEWLINSGIIKDPFAMANLRADVSWTGLEALVALILIAGVLAFFFLKKPYARIISLFTATIIFTFFTMFVFTGRIEGYTQRAALDFYRQHSEEDCYINTLGFKSYAHLFYSKKLPQDNPLSYDKEWLLNGLIDKPAYFVYKMIKKDEYSRLYPQLIVLYEKNGFIFAARYPEKLKPGL
ncbi:MAG: glycosyltransferase family 39 protein [Bacteroidales bacterium]|nr:glycosyltransferase family 39 protein [Bacteroidales bacterium]